MNRAPDSSTHQGRLPPGAARPRPAARLRARLRDWGMGERVLKTTLAVTLAWEIGTLIPGGTDHPYFAPLAALLSFQITVAESITAAGQRILGIVAGVAVALVVSRLVGETVWGVGLLVFLALVLGANLRLSPPGVAQVATSALIIMFVGGANNLGYAGARILESIVGASVGVAVNALLVPPTHLPEARTAEQQLGTAVARTLEALATAVAAGLTQAGAVQCLEQARLLRVPLAAAQAAIERADTALKYNVLRRAQHAALTQYRRDLITLEHAALQTRSLARVLADILRDADGPTLGPLWTQPGPWPTAFAHLLAALAAAVARLTDSADTRQSYAPFEQALDESARCRDELMQVMRAETPVLTPDAWMRLGALLATTDRLYTDLSPRAATADHTPDREDAPTAGPGAGL